MSSEAWLPDALNVMEPPCPHYQKHLLWQGAEMNHKGSGSAVDAPEFTHHIHNQRHHESQNGETQKISARGHKTTESMLSGLVFLLPPLKVVTVYEETMLNI